MSYCIVLSFMIYCIILLIDGLIDWCLMPTLTVFQLFRGVNFFYINLRHLHDL